MKRKTYIRPLSLIVIIITLFIAAIITSAQTRPSKPRGTIKTKLSRTAVIEKPASSIMIKGRILDPNNEPAYGTRIVALPSTSSGAMIQSNNKKGYFELPWSPTWLEKDQTIYIIAGNQRKKEAAFIEVLDPTQPITIHLESAPELRGNIEDTKGQFIPKCKAILSLDTEFKCQAPIFGTKARFPYESIFKIIPYGTKYRLTIKAEGYQTKQITVDTTDRSKEVIDIGTVILQPQDTPEPVDIKLKQNSDLAKEFYDIYRLDEGEVIKFIKPPFVLGRQEYLIFSNSHNYLNPYAMECMGGFQYCFLWDDKFKVNSASTGRRQRLNSLLSWMLQIPSYDFIVPKELKIYLSKGDWIVRADSTKKEQLKALEDIIYAETNRKIRFVKRKIERDVIVSKGRYGFKPHSIWPDHYHVHLTWDDNLSGGRGRIDSLKELFRYLEFRIKMKIVDETEPMKNTPIRYKQSSEIDRISNFEGIRKREALNTLLDNITKTTSLQFTVEKRPAEIWFVKEKSK